MNAAAADLNAAQDHDGNGQERRDMTRSMINGRTWHWSPAMVTFHFSMTGVVERLLKAAAFDDSLMGRGQCPPLRIF